MKRAIWIHRLGNLVLAAAFTTGILFYNPHLAYTQNITTPETPLEPAAPAQDIAQDTTAPESATCPEDPPMGQRAKLLDDREIGVVFTENKSSESFYYALDNPRDTKDLVYTADMGCSGGACKSIQTPAITMADLGGNDQFMAVMAFRDSEQRLAIGIPTEDGVVESWYSDSANAQGKNVDWINIAAGNLNGADTKDNSDEIVVAFKDDSKAINIMVPAAVDAPNQVAAYYRDDSTYGRGNVNYVSAATGDLDGDGYDNEIITVFKDGNKNLQVMILREQAGSQELKLLWHRSWADHYRHGIAYSDWEMKTVHPIDVTTGDVDGDFQDEVIIAFNDNNGETKCGSAPYGHVQLLVLDYIGDGNRIWSAKDINDQVFADVDPTEGCPWEYDDANLLTQTVYVAAADVDGDGRDEIALSFAFQNGWPPGSKRWESFVRLSTYDYVDESEPDYKICLNDNGNLVPCLQRRNNKIVLHYFEYKMNRISMDAGDLDRDGMAEIALAYADYDNSLHIVTYDAKDTINKRKDLKIRAGDEQIEKFNIAMADIDADAVYGTYANNHYLAWSSYVESVVHSPPYWPGDNDEDTEAAFGQSVGHGGGSGKTSETSIGGSVTVKAEFGGVGPSFTAGWEKSCAVEQTDVTIETEGTTYKTIPPSSQPENYYMDAVGYHMCPRCCYEYIENAYNTPVTICIPTHPCSEAQAGLDVWYKDRANADPPEGVGDSWVPVGMNFARGKPSQQSSTGYGGVPERAVDGSTDGVYANGSVTFTGEDQNSWWGVDMLIIPAVHAVQLWNRTDAAPERLSDFYVFLSENPFSSEDPDELLHDSDVWHYFHAGPADRLTTTAWSDFRDHTGNAPQRSRELTARYVRVQLTSRTSLSLAEVQVWGVPSRVDQWPEGAPSSSDTTSLTKSKTFTVTLPGGGKQVVDGEFILKRNDTMHVDDQGSPEFDNSIEEEWERMTETSTEVDAKVGFSIKVAEADFTTGSKNTRSRIMTWSKETEFSGEAGMIKENPHYEFGPYMWLQRAKSISGLEQAFLVLDYWVPYIQPSSSQAPSVDSTQAEPTAVSAPQAPLIASATHPSEGDWYDSSTVLFSWSQPVGDPAVVTGYHWYLDRYPDTIPPTYKSELTTTYSYHNLDDGIWYLHVRAKGEGDVWGETAHRAIKLDTQPPVVELLKVPNLPSGHSEWYYTPLSISVNAGDGPGSGIESIEVSSDNLKWRSYSGSLIFDSDTAGTQLWVKAMDYLGHVSEPVSTTFKIDKTLPDSRVHHGGLWGLLFAGIASDQMGNEHAVLAGAVEDALSGQAGMDLELNGNDWTSTSQDIANSWFEFPKQIADKITWVYDEILEFSRGNHYLRGRSQDRAGNLEDIYDLVGELVWLPQALPDLSGSSLTAIPAIARPGETIEFVAALRNSGNQEAWVHLSHTLPAGMSPLLDNLSADVNYDQSSRTLTWPDRLLWPGEWHRHHYRVLVDEGLGAMEIENQVTAHAYWPNTGDLPATEQGIFEDMEQVVNFSTTLAVDPALPLQADNLAPWVYLKVLGDRKQTVQQVELSIQSSPDARWMYIREWTLNGYTGEWQVAQNSGWLPFYETYPWTLSPESGVKYIGVWVSDETGNMSTLDEHSLDFTNLLASVPVLEDGQRNQYRFELEPGNQAIINLMADQGDPDLYGWDPYHALMPNYAAERDQFGDGIVFYPILKGIHLFEVLGRGESSYQLISASLNEVEKLSSTEVTAADKSRPQQPLTVSSPLSSGTGTVPLPPGDLRIHFPLVFNE